MNNSNDELGALGYNSSAPDLVETETATVHEEAEIPTLTQVLKLLNNRKKYFLSIDAISLEPEVQAIFNSDAQVAINKKVVFHIQELESQIVATINKVKETHENRGV